MGRVPIRCLLTALVVASLAGTSVAEEAGPFASQTFLGDYTLLEPVASKTGQDHVYVAPGAEEKLARFDAIMVDQPESSLSPASPYRSAEPDDLKVSADFMRGAIVERLEARGFRVVEREGDGALYLRAALTDLQLKKKKRGVLAYTPIGAVVHGIKAAVQNVMSNVDIIDMTGQAEVSESRTGEVLGALVSRHGVSADQAGAGKPERMTFDEFKAHVEEYADRLACRLENARRPLERRVDCTDPAARAVPEGGSPGT